VTFGTRDNYQTKNVTFDAAEILLPYNGLLGRPALAQFMVAAHHAYNMIKIPATFGVLTIRADIRDAVFCIAEMDKAVMAGEPGNLSAVMREDADSGPSAARKHFFPRAACHGVREHQRSTPQGPARGRSKVDEEGAPG
jgi:hypothetical protein